VTDPEGLRGELQAWIAEHWSLEMPLREWWRALADDGLSQPTLPPPFGRAMSTTDAWVVLEELARAGAVAPPQGGVGVKLAIPTIMRNGTVEQQRRFLLPLIRGEESWCQLFSEPGSGSDLASVSTRAVRDGDRWIVQGQKVWNSAADIARRGLLLARSNVDVPKHDGLSFFVLDMRQPGIEVRPLRQMNGESEFCEVFVSGAVVRDDECLLGEGQGWKVAKSTLVAERTSAGSSRFHGLTFVPSGDPAGYLDRIVGEILASTDRTPRRFTGNAIPSRRLIELARERGVSGEPLIRDALVRYFSMTMISRLNQARAGDLATRGQPIASIANILKLHTAMICRSSRDVAFQILGPDGALSGPDSPYGGQIQTVSLASFGASIGGGTDEIQRTLIGEIGLDLPREQRVDLGVPFKELWKLADKGKAAQVDGS
jgi:alkylation response protein AidB-like acyl-CoA dehydrogenase